MYINARIICLPFQPLAAQHYAQHLFIELVSQNGHTYDSLGEGKNQDERQTREQNTRLVMPRKQTEIGQHCPLYGKVVFGYGGKSEHLIVQSSEINLPKSLIWV